MNRGAILLLVAAIFALTLLIVGVVLWRVGAAARARPTEVTVAPDGSAVIPVRQLVLRRGGLFGTMSRNSFGPTLSIAADGVHFKVLGAGFWPYAEIATVDVGRTLFGTELRFSGAHGTLYASVANEGIARQALAALPAGVTLGPGAAQLRGR